MSADRSLSFLFCLSVLVGCGGGSAGSQVEPEQKALKIITLESGFESYGPVDFEPWKIDEEGKATPLANINSQGSSMRSDQDYAFKYYDNRYFFAANDGAGEELWVVNTLKDETQIFQDMNSSGGSFPDNYSLIGEKLFFQANSDFWVTDGIAENTTFLSDMAILWYPAIEFKGKAFFLGAPSGNAQQLWQSDGTPSGTKRVANIRHDGGHTGASRLALVRDNLLFFVDDGIHGAELWKSDGTEPGTSLLKDINLGNNSSILSLNSNNYRPEKCNGLLFFEATEASTGTDLWVSDATESGTFSLDLVPGPANSNPEIVGCISGEVVILAGNPWEVWLSNGTVSGTRKLGANIGNGLIDVLSHISYENKHYFWQRVVNGLEQSVQLWVTDGTVSGTRKIDASFDSEYNEVWAAREANGFLFFELRLVDYNGTSDTAHELWMLNPRSEQLTQVTTENGQPLITYYFN